MGIASSRESMEANAPLFSLLWTCSSSSSDEEGEEEKELSSASSCFSAGISLSPPPWSSVGG